MDVRKKLVELILNADNDKNLGFYDLYDLTHERTGGAEYFADYLIAHGVTVQEWISVDDRLPNLFENVLVFRDGKISIDYNEENGWFAYDLNGKRATLWVPLPHPPKGE